MNDATECKFQNTVWTKKLNKKKKEKKKAEYGQSRGRGRAGAVSDDPPREALFGWWSIVGPTIRLRWLAGRLTPPIIFGPTNHKNKPNHYFLFLI